MYDTTRILVVEIAAALAAAAAAVVEVEVMVLPISFMVDVRVVSGLDSHNTVDVVVVVDEDIVFLVNE